MIGMVRDGGSGACVLVLGRVVRVVFVIVWKMWAWESWAIWI